MTLKAAITTALAATLAALACGGGGGTPEEAVETFNGHMAAKDFERAAAVVYLSEWAGAPAAEVNARRAAYAGALAERYEDEGLDYGRAEIKEREKKGRDEVEFAVAYALRAKPGGPPATRKMALKKVDGRWYYVPAGR